MNFKQDVIKNKIYVPAVVEILVVGGEDVITTSPNDFTQDDIFE